jgi:hypothetical protein
VKRIMLFGLLAGALAATSGCGLFQSIFCYRPCTMRGDCCGGCCGDCCDDGCGPRCGARGCGVRQARVYADCGDDCCPECGQPLRGARCRSCGTCGPCGDCCGDACADPCGDCCYGRPWHRGPLSCLFALFTPAYWGGRGCGERYWGDFYSDPPDCWDPCDCNGNYTGRCHHCGGGYSDGYGGGRPAQVMPPSDENAVPQGDREGNPAPKPAAQPHKAAKSYSQPYSQPYSQ